jgi:phosphoribosylformimino-5-aminoimidazole carboxamide ribotide isomerase
MQIWPAIDLRGGRCVRLVQGDYERETAYADDPAAMAEQWAAQGAEFLHLVDLDGAKEGRPVNLESVRAIVSTIDIKCELGGGIRDEAAIDQLLQLGLSRLVIGTRALKHPDWFRQVCEKYPDKLVLGIDARDGLVATDGWLETSQTPAVDLAAQFDDAPLAALVYTDIARDGMLTGPNLDAMREMKQAAAVPVVASGGVSNVNDVARLAEIPMDGCIIGKALYEGTVSLPEALSAAGINK